IERLALDVLDQGVDGFENFPVLTLPFEIVLPGVFGPRRDHATAQPAFVGSISSCSVNLPSSASLIARSRRAAFAGLFRRWTVSMRPSYSSSDISTTLLAFWRVTTSGARPSHTASM